LPANGQKIPYTGLPTENPNDTVVPGKMRSDREEMPEGFTKEEADRTEIQEANDAKARSMQRGVSALAAPTDCRRYWPVEHLQVCGEIRVKYDSLGGSTSFLGPPSANDVANPDNYGRRQTFWNGPIYWSPATGAHPVVNSFLNRWQLNQYEAGPLKYPTTDEIVLPDGGRRQEFQQGAIYVAFQNAVGSAIFNGPLRDKYNSVGGLTPGSSFLGYLTEDHKRSLPDGQGQMARFQNGVIYWHPTHGAHPVSGQVLTQWASEGYERGPAGYPVKDQKQLSTGVEQQFQNNMHAWPRRVSDTYCGPVCTDPVYAAFPQFAGILDLISQPGAPSCDAIAPQPGDDDETFYECFDQGPALRQSGDGDANRAPSVMGTQPSGSILESRCYNKPSGEWLVERFYSCVYVSDLNGHGVTNSKGADGGRMNYNDVEIYVQRSEAHGRIVDIKFRAIPKLSGRGTSTILQVYPKCSIPGESCSFSEPFAYKQIYDNKPVEMSFTKEFSAPADEGDVTAPVISFEMKHVSTGGTPVDSYKPAPLPYKVGSAPTLRCDKFKAMRGTSDCVFSGAFPILAFSPKYNVPEVEWHVTQAQQSGLPGASQQFPLHKATDAETAETRSIACKYTQAWPDRPADKSQQCDEYPFAAAREGARPGTTARTYHPECGMTRGGNPLFNEESGPIGYSVCMLSTSQNGSAGSALTWFYQKYRINYGEAYSVKALQGEPPTPAPVS